MDDIYLILDQMFEWNRMKAARNVVKHGVGSPKRRLYSSMRVRCLKMIASTQEVKIAILYLAVRSDRMYCWLCM